MGETLVLLIVVTLSVCAGFGAITFLMLYSKSHRLRVRDPNKRHNYIRDYWVTEKVDKYTGIVWWKGIGNKLKVPEPPSECIEVGAKGRKFVECYRLTEDEYCWIQDTGCKSDNKVIESFEPFSAVQREVIVSQFKKAEEMKNKNWLKDNAVPIVSMLSLTIIVVSMFIFWADIAQPSLDSHNLALKVQDQNIKIMNSLGIAQGKSIAQIPGVENNQLAIITDTEDPPVAE